MRTKLFRQIEIWYSYDKFLWNVIMLSFINPQHFKTIFHSRISSFIYPKKQTKYNKRVLLDKRRLNQGRRVLFGFSCIKFNIPYSTFKVAVKKVRLMKSVAVFSKKQKWDFVQHILLVLNIFYVGLSIHFQKHADQYAKIIRKQINVYVKWICKMLGYYWFYH